MKTKDLIKFCEKKAAINQPFNGVLIEDNRMVATDGVRLAVIRKEVFSDAPENEGLFMPDGTVQDGYSFPRPDRILSAVNKGVNDTHTISYADLVSALENLKQLNKIKVDKETLDPTFPSCTKYKDFLLGIHRGTAEFVSQKVKYGHKHVLLKDGSAHLDILADMQIKYKQYGKKQEISKVTGAETRHKVETKLYLHTYVRLEYLIDILNTIKDIADENCTITYFTKNEVNPIYFRISKKETVAEFLLMPVVMK